MPGLSNTIKDKRGLHTFVEIKFYSSWIILLFNKNKIIILLLLFIIFFKVFGHCLLGLHSNLAITG